MIESIEREGDGFVATATGGLGIDGALSLLDHVAAADPPGCWLVVDMSRAERIEMELDDLHLLVRRVRDSPTLRAQRHAFVTSSSATRSHVLDYEFMITRMMDWWGNDPVQVAMFDDFGEAKAWATAADHESRRDRG